MDWSEKIDFRGFSEAVFGILFLKLAFSDNIDLLSDNIDLLKERTDI